jgi:hypothetical protein
MEMRYLDASSGALNPKRLNELLELRINLPLK